ncbi:uncharacterized protein LY79DRAFT_516187 [Colletotrichum navitas]|uniref:Uncharacterized protein n=1 Tax=Colletotrichum navitas TaxID=681940 RepID=A0AAD8V5H1_9PEZI|nr:uncharacterized protein LY79DRAFT_516187 [Colletotrichum navitas]KAK1590314.1 hypothetical protein LY79DRAFT_516187 [Colletotrichum navitas]
MVGSYLFPWLFLSLLSPVLADYDQCYYDAGLAGPRELLPCLPANETDNGVSWCCMAGQFCVNQACYDGKSGVTYQYGCNDPTYKDKNCPVKGGLDRAKSPWIGLVQCNNANEGELKFWASNHPDTCGENCPTEPDQPQVTQSVWPFEIQPLPPISDCKDLGKRVLAMYAPSALGSTGGVPATYTPPPGKPSPTRPPLRSSYATTTSIPVTQSASQVVSSGSSISTSSATPSATSSATSSTASVATNAPAALGPSSPALGNGAIAGIAVSSTAVAFSALFAIFILLRRRLARKRGIKIVANETEHDWPAGPAELPDDDKHTISPESNEHPKINELPENTDSYILLFATSVDAG